MSWCHQVGILFGLKKVYIPPYEGRNVFFRALKLLPAECVENTTHNYSFEGQLLSLQVHIPCPAEIPPSPVSHYECLKTLGFTLANSNRPVHLKKGSAHKSLTNVTIRNYKAHLSKLISQTAIIYTYSSYGISKPYLTSPEPTILPKTSRVKVIEPDNIKPHPPHLHTIKILRLSKNTLKIHTRPLKHSIVSITKEETH